MFYLLLAEKVLCMVSVAFGTKIAKREEREGNPLGFLEKLLNGYAINYTRPKFAVVCLQLDCAFLFFH